MKNLFRVIVLPLACLLTATETAAQIYECIDADGRIEFAQKCSPGTVRQREVAKTGNGAQEGAPAPAPNYKEEEAAFQRRQREREAQEKKEQANQKAAAKRCDSARSRLSSLERARRVTNGTDPKTGEPRYLDDAERAAAMQKARDVVAANCK